jgi:hypothetical protein
MIAVARFRDGDSLHRQMSGNPKTWPGLGAAPLAVWLAIGGALGLAAEGPRVADPQIRPTQTIFLDYRETAARIKGWRLDITPRTAPFRKEPDLAGRKVCRGTIQAAFRGVQKPGEHFENVINAPFLWDYTEGKLYLDLSRDGDLAKGHAFSTSERPATELRSGKYFYQPFTNIHLTFGLGADSQPRLVDIHLYGYDGQNQPGGNLVWRSFWQGKVSLEGRDWQIGLVEDANHLGTSQGGHLLLRPWTERDRAFNLENGSLDGFECPTNLFFHSRAYRLTFDYTKGAPPKYRLDLAEAAVELGELALNGQFINRLLFVQHQGQPPFTVVLDRPEPKTRIPVGVYAGYHIYLKEKGAGAFRNYQQPRITSISSKNTTVLNAGGPLTNSVVVGRHGLVLSLDYQCRGADGAYTMAGNDRTHPPLFAIHQAGQQIGSGHFEYG